jgi:hypothetical protein
MSNMTPFEIRLELLKMAKDMLSDDYYGKRESISNQYASQCEYAKLNGQPVPDHPGFPPFPSESEIIVKANALNGFVSQQIPNSTQEKTIKKST